jgi:hypothetical protein
MNQDGKLSVLTLSLTSAALFELGGSGALYDAADKVARHTQHYPRAELLGICAFAFGAVGLTKAVFVGASLLARKYRGLNL